MMKHSLFGIAIVLITHVKRLVGCNLNPWQLLSYNLICSMSCPKTNALDTCKTEKNSPGSRVCNSISSRSLIFKSWSQKPLFIQQLCQIFYPIRLSFFSFIVNDFPQYPYLICQLVQSMGLRGNGEGKFSYSKTPCVLATA